MPVRLVDRHSTSAIAAQGRLLRREVPRVGGKRGVLARDGRLDLANRHQTLRLAERERPQQHAVHDREDGGGRAERQGESGHDRGRIQRIAADGPHGVSEIEQHAVHAGFDGSLAARVVGARLWR